MLSSNTPSTCPQATVPSIGAPTLGEAEDDGLMEGDAELLGLRLAEGDREGDGDDDGEVDALGLTLTLSDDDGDTDALGETLGLSDDDGDTASALLTLAISSNPAVVGDAVLSVNDWLAKVEPVSYDWSAQVVP